MGDADSSEDPQVTSDRLRVDFLKTDLDMCCTFVDLAKTRFKMGNCETAEQALSDAEKGYETINRFLSDPKHANNLTTAEMNAFTSGLGKLRNRLDEVRRLSK